MGNWRTVNIVGTCDENEVAALRAACEPGSDYENFHCLSTNNSICGLNKWVASKMNATGNLAERDYSIESVADQLSELVKVAPSLSLKVHCGGDYEAKECVATITVRDGAVTVGEPEIQEIEPLDAASMESNLLSAIWNAGRY